MDNDHGIAIAITSLQRATSFSQERVIGSIWCKGYFVKVHVQSWTIIETIES